MRPPLENLFPKWIGHRHGVPVVYALAFELRLESFPSAGHRPYILRPTVALLRAECTSLQSGSQQREGFGATVDPYLVTQRLACPRRARWVQTEIARIPLVLRIPTVADTSDLRLYCSRTRHLGQNVERC